MATREDFQVLAEMLDVDIPEDEPIREIPGDFGIKHQIIMAHNSAGHIVWLAASNQELYFGEEWLRRKVEPIFDTGKERFFTNSSAGIGKQFIEWPAGHPLRNIPWLLNI